jgi:hypothetical protein
MKGESSEMIRTLETGLNGFPTGECATMARFQLKPAKFAMENAFYALTTKIAQIKPEDKDAGILETAGFAKKFLSAVEWYEHVLAMKTTADSVENVKKQSKNGQIPGCNSTENVVKATV